MCKLLFPMLQCCVKISGLIWFLFSSFVTSIFAFFLSLVWQAVSIKDIYCCLGCFGLTFSLTHPITTPCSLSPYCICLLRLAYHTYSRDVHHFPLTDVPTLTHGVKVSFTQAWIHTDLFVPHLLLVCCRMWTVQRGSVISWGRFHRDILDWCLVLGLTFALRSV